MASMEQQEERLLLLDHPLPEIVEAYTCDGSLDIDGKQALKRCTGSWRACSSILGTEFCYCLAFYGITKNLVTYLTTVLHESNVIAANNVSIWQATGFLTPLAGAIVADSYWGSYKTLVVSSSICFSGMIMLALSSLVPNLKPTSFLGLTFPALLSAQEIMFFLGLYMIAFGSGGIRPCVPSFGANQFDDTDPSERIKKGSFFNWYIFTINSGSVISGTVIVWVQDHYGWALGFAIPTVLMAIALGNFVVASRLYRFQRTGGSPLTRVCQVIVAAVWKYNLDLPSDSSLLYELSEDDLAIKGCRKLEHSADLKFFDKAAIVTPSDEEPAILHNPWRLCTVTQVEELKILVRMLPIWATIIFFYAVSAQASSTFIEQGMVMDNSVGSFSIPPASLSTFDVLTVVTLALFYDRVFVPVIRRFSRKERGISDLHRIAIGLSLPVLVMVSAALVEMKRLQIARANGLVHHKVAVPMSILWQAPQYFFVGVGEVFTTIGQLEFFYGQAPVAMRSVCMALGLLAIAVGSYLSSFIMTVVVWATATGRRPGWIPDNLNEGHLDYFFWLMAGLGCLNLIVFACCATRCKSKKAS